VVLSFPAAQVNGGSFLSSPSPASLLQYDPDILFDKGVTLDSVSDLYPLPPEPRDMAMGDLNGDSLQDVVVVFNGSYLYIFNGTSDGRLDPLPWNISLAAKNIGDVRSVAIGQLNNDLQLDIVISYSKPYNGISILYQHTGFNPTASTDLPLEAEPFQLVVGEFSGDAHNDIATVLKNDQIGVLAIYRYPFSISGADIHTELIPSFTNTEILVAGIINDDSKQDLLVCNYSGRDAYVFYQPTVFTTWKYQNWGATLLSASGQFVYAELTDLNGDSKDDLILINSKLYDDKPRVEIRYNNGNGFSSTADKLISSYPGTSSLAFSNRTGGDLQYLSLINCLDNNCSVYYRTNAGEWSDRPNYEFPTDKTPIEALFIGLGSFSPRLLVLSTGDDRSNASLSIYISRDGVIGNSDKDILMTGMMPGQLRNGILQGHPTIATLIPSSNRVLLYDIKTGQRAFLVTGNDPSALTFGDFDGDGLNDIAVIEASRYIRIFKGSTDLIGGLGNSVMFDSGLTLASSVTSGRPADSDRDYLVIGGEPGVMVVYDALEESRAFEHIGSSTSGNRRDVMVGNFFIDSVGGDIVALNSIDGSVEIYRRIVTGAPGSQYNNFISVDMESHIGLCLTAADYNGDEHQDIAVGCSSGIILIYEQSTNNDGFYPDHAIGQRLHVPFIPAMLCSGDLNDDGMADIAVSRCDLPLVNVYLSMDGAPSINSFNLTTGCIASGLYIGDINGDGRDDLAASSSGSKSISMWFQNNLVPVAGASLSSSDIQEGGSVSFDASASQDSFSDRDSLQYLWNFGDGNTSTGMVADHIYEADGIYDGYLIVTDRGGLSDRVDFTVVVTDIAPIADFVWEPRSPLEGEEVRFRDNSTSYDGIVAYEWDFDEDGTIDSREKDPIYTFHSDGTYRVRLTVHEEDGGSNLSLAIIEVRDRVPVAGIGPLSPVQEGTTFTAHDASISYDEIVFRQWDFGDGTKSNDLDPTHYYNADGTYVITLTVRDADGDESVATATIEVLDSSPSANFEAAPNPVSEGSFVSFSDNSSAFDRISSWHWDFGDGNTSDERNPTHAYTIPKGYLSKVFTVTLTVTDGDGSTSQRMRDLTVLQTSPVIISLIAEGGAVFNEDQEISFLAHAQKTNFNITGYAWDFDYDPSSGFDPVPGVTVNRTYWTYPSAGEYRVCLRVYDYNSYSEQILVVTVRNLAPVAELSHVKSSDGWVTFDATRSTDTPSDLSGLTFRWNFGDGKGWTAWSPNATIVHQFDDGSYTVTVQVRDGDGAVAERGITISIDRLPPEIGYDGALPTEAYIGDQIRVEVNVTDRSAIAQVVLFYTFGDETRSIPMTRLSGTDLFVAIISSFNTTGTLTYHVEATDSHGYSYDTTAVQVTIAPRPDGTVPLIVAALAAAILLSMFLYVRMYRMVIDEVFVIYHDGNLIAHQTRRLKPGMDDQVLGSMLAAVQSFVRDSFKDEASTGLNRLDFGEKKILVERGQFLIVAAVLHGKREGRAAQRLKEVLRRTETKYADVLTDWDGDLEKLRGIKEETNEVMRFRIRESLVGDGKDSEWPDERGGAS